MAKIELTRIEGRAVDGDHAYNEFGALEVKWKPPGFVLRWIDRDPQVLYTRKRQGWKICDLQRDFVKRGCPEELLPTTDVTGTEIIFGECILGMMPVALYEERYKRNVLEKVKQRRRAGIENARAEGERVARELRNKGVRIKGDNVIEEISQEERDRDFSDPYDVKSRDRGGERVADAWRDKR